MKADPWDWWVALWAASKGFLWVASWAAPWAALWAALWAASMAVL